jgi:hypothetical protein
MKHVHDHVDEIEQGPTARSHPLGVVRVSAPALDRLEDALGQGADMCVGSAGRDDEHVGSVTHPAQVEQDDVVRLVGFEGLDSTSQVPKRIRI